MNATLIFPRETRWRDIRFGSRPRWYVDLRWRIGRLVSPSYRLDIVDTGLGHGWHDCDDVLLHASFAVLCRYVEDEVPSTGCHRVPPAAAEIHHWWRVERPAELAAIAPLRLDRDTADEAYRRQKALYEQETEMLRRLAGIRRCLWT